MCFLHITLYKLSSTHFPSELSWRTKLNPSTQCRTCKRSRSRSTRTRAGALLTRPPWRLPLRFPKAISVLARIPQLVIAPLHGWVVFGSRWTCWTAFPSALALLSFACLAAFQQRRLLASQCDDSDNIAGSKAWESIGKSLKDLENVREGSNRRRRNLRRQRDGRQPNSGSQSVGQAGQARSRNMTYVRRFVIGYRIGKEVAPMNVTGLDTRLASPMRMMARTLIATLSY